MSETTLLVGNFRGMKVKPGSMGKPGPGYKVDIVDDQGKRNMPILEVFKILLTSYQTSPPKIMIFRNFHLIVWLYRA